MGSTGHRNDLGSLSADVSKSAFRTAGSLTSGRKATFAISSGMLFPARLNSVVVPTEENCSRGRNRLNHVEDLECLNWAEAAQGEEDREPFHECLP
jgi:hypothetical protein